MLSAIDRLSGIIEDQDTADLSFTIPEDLLAASQDGDQVIFNLTVTDGKTSLSKNISLSIIKKNNGTIAGLASPTLRGSGYSIPAIDALLSQDPDGISHPDTIQYQWQKHERSRWININGETGTSYTPHAAEMDHPYRVFAYYTDNQGYRESIVSEETSTNLFESMIERIYIRIKVFLEGALN